MIPTAIFSSQTDLPWAHKCAEHMEALGFQPHIITNIGSGSLIGADIAREMVAAMIQIADGGIIAKCDVDSKLSQAGADWLHGSTAEEARAFSKGHNNTCIAFACHLDRLTRIKDWLVPAYGNACASCTISFGLRSPTISGGTMARQRGAYSFTPAYPNPTGAMIATLPKFELSEMRDTAMSELWA
jgi:hypothetical protein